MCMKTPKAPPVPVVEPAPTREQVVAKQASTAKADAATKVKSVTESAKKSKEQRGVLNNIKTSMTGDWYYGRKTTGKVKFGGDTAVAKFGGAY